MRTAVLFGRFCLNLRGSPQLPSRFPSRLRFFARPPSWPWPRARFGRFPSGKGSGGGGGGKTPVVRTVLWAALTPGAFLELAEGGDGSEKTGEMQMLEVSRDEIRKSVAEDAKGLTRLRQSLYVWCYCYVYDPIATGFRFAHLVLIFMPVILTFPAIWIGKRVQDRGGERMGTLWWFQFLVRSMERAGPAFIKVGGSRSSCKAYGIQAYLGSRSLGNGQHPGLISFLRNCAALCPLCIPMPLRIRYVRQRESSERLLTGYLLTISSKSSMKSLLALAQLRRSTRRS